MPSSATGHTLVGGGILISDSAKAAEDAQQEAEAPKDTTWVPANAAMLPPVPREKGPLLTLLEDPTYGLPSTDDFQYRDYHSKLSLDYVGQPYLAAGVDPLGLQLGGGAALFWSDMLGNHNLVTALQIQTDGGFTDVGAALAYQNLKHRWTWGLEGQQVPYTLFAQAAGVASAGNFVEQDVSFRQLNREVAGVISYPFNRFLRTDLTVGYQYVSFAQKVRNITFDQSGNMISDQTTTFSNIKPLNLGITSADIVYDNAVMGATSPVIGQRIHLEGMPMFGSINFTNAIVDLRKYVMPVRPFTFAFRVLHYGRYGSGAEDNRLTPLFIGYSDLVRGYDAGSFTNEELAADSSHNVFNRLFGSKIAVANFELRFPLFGALHLGGGYYGILPLETGVFYDAGAAWQTGIKPTFLSGGTQKPVRSYGAMARKTGGAVWPNRPSLPAACLASNCTMDSAPGSTNRGGRKTCWSPAIDGASHLSRLSNSSITPSTACADSSLISARTTGQSWRQLRRIRRILCSTRYCD